MNTSQYNRLSFASIALIALAISGCSFPHYYAYTHLERGPETLPNWELEIHSQNFGGDLADSARSEVEFSYIVRPRGSKRFEQVGVDSLVLFELIQGEQLVDTAYMNSFGGWSALSVPHSARGAIKLVSPMPTRILARFHLLVNDNSTSERRACVVSFKVTKKDMGGLMAHLIGP